MESSLRVSSGANWEVIKGMVVLNWQCSWWTVPIPTQWKKPPCCQFQSWWLCPKSPYSTWYVSRAHHRRTRDANQVRCQQIIWLILMISTYQELSVRLFLAGDYEFLCRMYGLSGASGMWFYLSYKMNLSYKAHIWKQAVTTACGALLPVLICPNLWLRGDLFHPDHWHLWRRITLDLGPRVMETLKCSADP